MNGKLMSGGNVPLLCRENGMGHIHDDRIHVGSAADLSIRDNFLAAMYRSDAVKKGPFLDYRKANEIVEENVKKYKVKIGKITDEISSLSGGNMQKLIIAREMYMQPRLLIASQPTRGVDIGAIELFISKLSITGIRATQCC